MIKKLLHVAAFFFPSPVNVWIHRLAGAKIGRHVSIHPAVLILARKVEIGGGAVIKFGTMINVRTFKLGRKSSIGFFTLAKGESDLIIGDACIIGPRSMINCCRPVIMEYYSGVGPGCYLYTHGSGMPVTEGYRVKFGPIHIKEKAWVNMRCTIGAGVTVGKGSIVMPGTILVESVEPGRMVVGNPAKLNDLPLFLIPQKYIHLDKLAQDILKGFCEWSNEYEDTSYEWANGVLKTACNGKSLSISLDGGDIAVLTTKGQTRSGMYFNLADLSADEERHPVKQRFEAFMRLYYGLIFT